jgi:hypothetical protein
MALGPQNFNLTISLDSLFCFQGDDIDDVFDEESEPYLWVFMIKLDAEGLQQNGNFLSGNPTYRFPASSHGNIGGSILRGTRQIPAGVGRWTTSLRPIPITVAGQTLTTIPGMIIVGAVLLEENLTPNSAIEAARRSSIDLIKSTATSTLASMGLAGIAADAAAAVVSSGGTLTLNAAAQQVVAARLKPIQDLFAVAAPASAVVTILNNLDAGGFLGTAIDRDKPMGTFAQSFGQAALVSTTEGSPIEINKKMWNMPEWAYTLHGRAWAHRKFVRRALPSSPRLRVMCSSKGAMLSEARRIVGIGGVDGNVSWGMSRPEAAQAILESRRSFFVLAANGAEVEVHAVQGGYWAGRPWYFLQTSGDSQTSNNLVNLPDCPPGASMYDEVWY